MIEPFTVFRPKQATSVLYDSPHSGRYYPPAWKTLAAQDALRRGEDAYVDELLASSVNSGATLLIASYARCYIDLNRAEDDIDPEMLSDAWPGALSPSEKSRRGLGLVRRFVTPGVAVNAGPLASRVIIERIETVYRPVSRGVGQSHPRDQGCARHCAACELALDEIPRKCDDSGWTWGNPA